MPHLSWGCRCTGTPLTLVSGAPGPSGCEVAPLHVLGQVALTACDTDWNPMPLLLSPIPTR